jgi:hypothetical protein
MARRARVTQWCAYLLGPEGSYDVELNAYFTGASLRGSPKNTQAAVAYDLKKWLAFLTSSRDRLTWRDATTEDRAAFEQWRRNDPRGPRIASTTSDREVATVNWFYQWAVRQGHVVRNPLVQRPSRARRRSLNEPIAQTPAEASHMGPRRDLTWLTPAMYRCCDRGGWWRALSGCESALTGSVSGDLRWLSSRAQASRWGRHRYAPGMTPEVEQLRAALDGLRVGVLKKLAGLSGEDARLICRRPRRSSIRRMPIGLNCSWV